jgi:hypothetical protein
VEEQGDFTRLEYVRDDEGPWRWPYKQLARPPGDSGKFFYPASDGFALFTGGKTRTSKAARASDGATTGEPLPFPEYVLMSENHFSRRWSKAGHRRLKNALVVMEWLPAPQRVTLRLPTAAAATTAADNSVEATEAAVGSSRQEQHLNDAFLLLGSAEGGLLNSADVAEATRAMGIPTGLQHKEVMAAVDRGHVGVDFRAFRHMFEGGGVYRTQQGRHFVLLSLLEAETLRANLHLERELAAGDAACPQLALHAMGQLGGGYTLDASDHFPPSQPFQVSSGGRSRDVSAGGLLTARPPRPPPGEEERQT